jgi:23S rRNA (uracil1939-C5)-methyltransferase
MLTMAETLTIDRIGAKGDAVAITPTGEVFVAGALPGETVLAVVDGEHADLVSVDQASPERVTPVCPLFGTCGGCALQHWADEPYARWKQGRVTQTLAQAGLAIAPAPLVMAHGEGRRRVTFHARRTERGIAVGFMARRSHDLVPVETCPVLAPGLARAPHVALAVAEALGGAKPLDIQVTLTAGGLDMDVRGHGPVSDGKRRVLGALARDLGLVRLSVHGDIVIALDAPVVAMDGAMVAVPPGGFLQATEAGEAALAALVLDGVGSAKSVADLFSGIGPFALRLARRARVHAVEQDGSALEALEASARQTSGLKPLSTEARDLFRRPLIGPELTRFDAVVFDPPRAGADAQAKALAASVVPRVVAVSCNAATFARDAKALVAGGYRLVTVTPVDQFLYSAHVELVGVFEKTATRPRKRPLLG